MTHQRHSATPTGRRGLRMAAVLAVGAGATLTACSSSAKANPTDAVDSSVSALGKSSSISMRVSLGVTPEQAQQLSKKGGGSPMTPAEAKALSSGSIFFTEQTGQGEPVDSAQAMTDTKDAYDLGLQFGSSVPFELKYVGQNLYVRADVNQILTDVGQDPSKAASFQKDLGQINSVVPGISDLGAGKWVEVSHASLTTLGNLLKSAEASQGSGQPSPSQLQATFKQLRASALSSLKANSTTTSMGDQGGRPEYAVTVNVHNFLASFGPELQKDVSALPFVGSKVNTDFTKIQDKVPAGQTATADLFTSGGKLSEVDVDLNQFAKGSDKLSFAVPVKMEFTAPPAISTPSGATTLDLSQLPQLLQQIMGAAGSSNNSASSPTSTASQ